MLSRFSAILVIAACLLSPNAAAQSSRLDQWRSVAGCWAGEAHETNSIGEDFRQTGRMLVRATDSGISVEETFRVTLATGHYAPLADAGLRHVRENWTFDARSNLLMIAVDDGPGRAAGISADGRAFFRTFLFYHPRREMTLRGEARGHIVNNDEIEHAGELIDVFGDYRESYRLTWRRIGSPDAACLFTD